MVGKASFIQFWPFIWQNIEIFLKPCNFMCFSTYIKICLQKYENYQKHCLKISQFAGHFGYSARLVRTSLSMPGCFEMFCIPGGDRTADGGVQRTHRGRHVLVSVPGPQNIRLRGLRRIRQGWYRYLLISGKYANSVQTVS